MNELHFHLGDRVRIKNDIDPSLYQWHSTMGNEGWVRQIKEDRFGLPVVYIEWDKNHWTYNGAPDGWTFAEHFDPIESESEMSKDKSQDERFAVAMKLLQDLAEEEKSENIKDAPERPKPFKAKLQSRVNAALGTSEDEEDQDRSHAIHDASDAISEADAFVVIAVNRIDHPHAENGVMVPQAITWGGNPVAELILGAQLSQMATESYQEIILQLLNGTVESK